MAGSVLSAARPAAAQSGRAEGPLLAIEGLSVEFLSETGRFRAVEDVSFHVDRGETVVLVGESGSGKSVTSLALMGLLDRRKAKVTVSSMPFRRRDGSVTDLARLTEPELRQIRGNEIAMIFQEPMTSLNPVFTIGRQIAEAIVAHRGGSWPDAMDEACRLLGELGIAEPERRLHSYPHLLSGGMRQRVMIAMALACRPTLLIADEPTTALDVTIQAQIVELIRSLQQELGMAVLFITHNLGVAAEIADRIVVMYAGRTVEEGPCRPIFAAPRMPYTRGLLRSVPRLGVAYEEDVELPSIIGNVPSPNSLPPGCSFHPRCTDFHPGLCDASVPPYEECGTARRVRCLRWRELGGET